MIKCTRYLSYAVLLIMLSTPLFADETKEIWLIYDPSVEYLVSMDSQFINTKVLEKQHKIWTLYTGTESELNIKYGKIKGFKSGVIQGGANDMTLNAFIKGLVLPKDIVYIIDRDSYRIKKDPKNEQERMASVVLSISPDVIANYPVGNGKYAWIAMPLAGMGAAKRLDTLEKHLK